MSDRLDIANAREPHEAEARRRALAANNEAIDAAELSATERKGAA